METHKGTGPHILVIDDDEAIRELLCEVLAEEGYCVSASRTAPEDLEHIHGLELDLLLLDILLGDVRDGLAFLEQIKADPRLCAIPVLVCTAALHLTDEINERLTAWDCLTVAKPFDLDALLDEVRRCLESQQREQVSA